MLQLINSLFKPRRAFGHDALDCNDFNQSRFTVNNNKRVLNERLEHVVLKSQVV